MIFKNKKVTQTEIYELMDDFVSDMQAMFSLLQEDIIQTIDENKNGTVENIINEVGKLLS